MDIYKLPVVLHPQPEGGCACGNRTGTDQECDLQKSGLMPEIR